MTTPPQRYDEGLEMSHYQGMEVHEQPRHNGYQGMEVNPYGGMETHQYPGGEDDTSEKPALHERTNVYDEDPRSRLHRDLKTRQIAMIALGGALGTGLLINTGPTLVNSGPASMFIGYALVGVLCYTVMTAMGEMAAWLPLASGFTGFAHRFVDPALGFALGWNYWFKYIITTPNNLIASALIIHHWLPQEHPALNALWVTLLLTAIITINYFGVGLFGEFEFWLSSAKVLIMIGLIIFTLVIAAGGAPNHENAGFHYWKHGGFAAYGPQNAGGRFLGFWNVMSNAVFSYLGAELVGITVGEARNPRKAIPRAVRLTFFRIVFFYLALILLLGLIVPHDNPHLLSAASESQSTINADVSPFVVAAKIAGITVIPQVINVCLLIFTFSAANSDLYIATRSLYSLAIEGNAPRIFSRTNDQGVPIYALALSSLCCTSAYMSVKLGAFKTFQLFVQLVTIFGILTWISILISHIYFVRARKAQGIPETALAYISPFGVRGSMAAVVFACIITFFNGWADFVHGLTDTSSALRQFNYNYFVVDYLPVPIYLALYFGYKFIMKTELIKAVDADLLSGKARIDEDEAEFLAGEMRRKGGMLETKWERVYRLTLGNFF